MLKHIIFEGKLKVTQLQFPDLLNEDLADDVRCAKRVYDRVGFKGWPLPHAHCREKALPDLSRC